MDQNEIFELVSAATRIQPKDEPLREDNDLLNQIKDQMQVHEQLKYPSPPYKYKRAKSIVNHAEVDLIHIEYNGEKLTPDQLDQMATHSLVVRKLSILAGILNGLRNSRHFLSSDPRQQAIIERDIATFYNEAINKKDEDISSFIDRMTASIKQKTGNENENSIIRQIRNAERYFVAHYNQNRIIVHETKMYDDTIYEVDIPYINELTQEQRIEFMGIHSIEPPEWFKNLSTWEQELMEKMVPKSLDENERWKNFEKMNQSSAMQHIPGVKNARTSYLLTKADPGYAENIGEYEVVSSSLKTSTLVPYEMQTNSRAKETNQSVNRVLNRMQQSANTSFEKLWGNIFEGTELKPLVLMQGLLSDTLVGGDDNKLVSWQMNAAKTLSKHSDYNNIQIITGNDPTNFLRFTTSQKGFLSTTYLKRWEHTNQVLQYSYALTNKLTQIGEDALTDKQKQRLQFISLIRSELEKMRNDDYIHRLDRNFQAFKVAYTELLVEAMGGAVSTNCKSGKDRTGLDEIYVKAMRLYFNRYKELPSYGASPDKRKQFIDIFVKLFNSRKTQEAAAKNTPGSFGIKDNAMMLCRDIADELGESYGSSNRLANLNKPKKFQADEVKEKKELGEKELIKNEINTRVLKKQKPIIIFSPFIILKNLISFAVNKNFLKDKANRALQKHVIFLQNVRNNKPDSFKNNDVGLIKNSEHQALYHDLAKIKENIVNLIAKLDEKVGKKKKAVILINKLNILNKRIQQIEANIDIYDEKKLSDLTAQISRDFENEIKSSSRSWVKRATSIFRGSDYDTILSTALNNLQTNSFNNSSKNPKVKL